MATKGNLAYCASKLSGGNMVPGNHLERFKPHRHRVLNLYKQSLRQMDRMWGSYSPGGMCNVPYHQMALEMTLLRARFEENKHIKSLAKATELLKGECLVFGLNGLTTFHRRRRRILGLSGHRRHQRFEHAHVRGWHRLRALLPIPTGGEDHGAVGCRGVGTLPRHLRQLQEVERVEGWDMGRGDENARGESVSKL